MKKFLFSALACVAFAGSSFASNEVLENVESSTKTTMCAFDKEIMESDLIIKEQLVFSNGLCEIVIFVFDRRGNLIDAVSRRSANVSSDWCANSYNRMLDMVMADYSIEEYDISGGYGHTPY